MIELKFHYMETTILSYKKINGQKITALHHRTVQKMICDFLLENERRGSKLVNHSFNQNGYYEQWCLI